MGWSRRRQDPRPAHESTGSLAPPAPPRPTCNVLRYKKHPATTAAHAAGHTVVRNHLSYRGPIAIDARMKPGYPAELACRDDIAATVSGRWAEYFPAGGVEMGDSGRAHLD